MYQRLSLLQVLSSVLTFLLAIEMALAAETAPKKSEGYVTVREFGALGDGQADDTAAIQNAVNAAIGDIRFQRGEYRITKPIVVELDKVGPTSLVGDGTARIVMVGSGPAIKLLGTHTGSAAPQDVKPEVWQRQRMPMVDGLEIVGAHPEACGIEVDATMHLTLTRVGIRECLHGIHLVRSNRNVLIANCHLYHNRGVGLYLDDVDLHQINVTGSHICFNAAGGIVSRAGNVRNLQITGCDVESNGESNAPRRANVLIDCTGGAAGTAEVAITGCTIQHNPSPGSANILFLGSNRPDHRWGHLVIANSILTDVRVNVDIENARGVSIVGNTFGSGSQRDLRIVDSCNVVIGPNVLERNPLYGDEKSANGGVLLRNCQDMTISGLHVTQVRRLPAGIELEKCRRVNLTGCTILDCDNAGLLLKEVSHSLISGCLIRHDQSSSQPWDAVKMEASNGNTLANNVLGESHADGRPQ